MEKFKRPHYHGTDDEQEMALTEYMEKMRKKEKDRVIKQGRKNKQSSCQALSE